MVNVPTLVSHLPFFQQQVNVLYVDKENKAIIFNPRYYDYNRFQTQSSDNRPKRLPYSEERIAEGVLRFDQKELEVPDKQIDK